jgi:hypothetical protein
VSYWFKQDEIHAHTHVHGCPAFLPWHRELLNRFEELIREIDPQLSLHYWDWNDDPANASDGQGGFVNLFTPDFMGNANDPVTGHETQAGKPWLTAGFYDPQATPFRSDSEFDPANNPVDPPRTLMRNKSHGVPPVGKTVNGLTWPTDDQLIDAPTWEAFNDLMGGCELETSNNCAHGMAHSYIGGTLGNAHTSFRDPFVFLLHSNVDRLFALWQLRPGHSERLDPTKVYGNQAATKGDGDVATGEPHWGILSPLEPWAGPAAQNATTGVIANVRATRPWAAPECEQLQSANQKDSRHPSVVKLPLYDTNPTRSAESSSTSGMGRRTGESTSSYGFSQTAPATDAAVSVLAPDEMGALAAVGRVLVQRGPLPYLHAAGRSRFAPGIGYHQGAEFRGTRPGEGSGDQPRRDGGECGEGAYSETDGRVSPGSGSLISSRTWRDRILNLGG